MAETDKLAIFCRTDHIRFELFGSFFFEEKTLHMFLIAVDVYQAKKNGS